MIAERSCIEMKLRTMVYTGENIIRESQRQEITLDVHDKLKLFLHEWFDKSIA